MKKETFDVHVQCSKHSDFSTIVSTGIYTLTVCLKSLIELELQKAAAPAAAAETVFEEAAIGYYLSLIHI